MNQDELDLFPRASVSNIEGKRRRLIHYLADRPRWVTRKALRRELGFSDRDCRLARQAAVPDVIYGQRGMKAFSNATPGEIQHCIRTLRSQAGEMERQAIQYMRALRNKARP